MARFILRYTGTSDALATQREQLMSVLAAMPFNILDDSQRMLLIELSMEAPALQSLLPAWKVIKERSLSLPRDPRPNQDS